MEHLGIGGCTGLNGALMLRALPELCPHLKALNMHKMEGTTVASLVALLFHCRSLVSLDCHDCDFLAHGESGARDLTSQVVLVAASKWHIFLGGESIDQAAEAHDQHGFLGLATPHGEGMRDRWLALGHSKFGEVFHESTVIRTSQPIIHA